MKKTALSAALLIFFLSFPLFAQSEAEQAYIKAITTPDISQKVKLLKEYLQKYEGKGTKYENHVYAHLCLLPFQGKTPQQTIDYGEKALALGGLDDLTKAQVWIQLSGIYSQLGQNLEKAKSYAFQVVNLAKANKNKENETESPQQWNQFIGAGYFAHAQALEKADDLGEAVDSYINSYKILKKAQIVQSLKKIGKSLYDQKNYTDAEKAFKVACEVTKDFGSCAFYAKTLYRNGKKDEALKYFKQAYAQQKSGEIAYNIGIILAGKARSDPSLSEEAIKYLLDASFLSPKNSKKAMELAKNLFFVTNKDLNYNQKVEELSERSKKLEELTETFNQNFGDKAEEDLSDAEKKEMEKLLAEIEAEKKAIKKLEAEQQAALEKFNHLIEQTKKRLGIS
ncbi:MAG: tetratricopeptide repeat protein [Candidatus Aminicenantes bacterium]